MEFHHVSIMPRECLDGLNIKPDGIYVDATTGGGASKPNNQIIDGKTFYREVLEYYQDLANGQIDSEESGLTEEEIELIKKYLGIV